MDLVEDVLVFLQEKIDWIFHVPVLSWSGSAKQRLGTDSGQFVGLARDTVDSTWGRLKNWGHEMCLFWAEMKQSFFLLQTQLFWVIQLSYSYWFENLSVCELKNSRLFNRHSQKQTQITNTHPQPRSNPKATCPGKRAKRPLSNKEITRKPL